MFNAAERFADEAKEIIRQADLANRDLEPEEAGKVEELLERSRQARAQQKQSLDLMGGGLPDVGVDSAGGFAFGSPGERFVHSKGYQRVRNPDTRGQAWTSGPVDVGMMTKGTILSTPGSILAPPSYVPGVVGIPDNPLVVGDLIPSSPTNAAVVRYVKETVATNAAAGVSEGSAKPESTLTFNEGSVPIRKIATFLPVSDEFLEDAPAIQGYLNSRLSMFVRTEEERQILRGSGAAPQIRGFINSYSATGVGSATVSSTTGTALAVGLFNVMNNQRGSSMLEPDGLIVHPQEYAKMRLGRDGQGQFFGGGPWQSQYGGPQGPVTASRFGDGQFWGVRVLVTPVVGKGTALVGSFGQGAHVYRRGGLTVEASNAHQDYFKKNLVALRAESRQGLAIQRGAAFTVVKFT